MPEEDLSKLDELREFLDGADRWSPVGHSVRAVRGSNTGFNSPVNRAEALRWALRHALAHLPVDEDGRDLDQGRANDV